MIVETLMYLILAFGFGAILGGAVIYCYMAKPYEEVPIEWDGVELKVPPTVERQTARKDYELAERVLRDETHR